MGPHDDENTKQFDTSLVTSNFDKIKQTIFMMYTHSHIS